MKDTLRSHGQAIEDSFFRSVDQALIEFMKEEGKRNEARKRLSESTGINDKSLLDDLLDSGVSPATIITFFLLPLIEVAWADRRVDKEEETAVVNTAIAFGYDVKSAGMELLKSWLRSPPNEKLFLIWKEYAKELVRHLNIASRENLTQTIVKRAKTVAEANGGFLGIHKMAAAERDIIEEIKEALSH